MMTNPVFYGIKKGTSADRSVKHKEAGSLFDYTNSMPVQKDPPGRHLRISADEYPPNPSAFRRGRSVAHTVKPDDFLRLGTGFGGNSTSRAKTLIVLPTRLETIGHPPPSNYATPRNNPPNTQLRRSFELGDLPCHIDQNSGGRKLKWHLTAEELDYSLYLPIFFDGLREEETPLPFYATEGIKDLLKMAPEKVAPVIPQIILSVRMALNTRIPDVMRRTIVALTQLAKADVTSPSSDPSSPVSEPKIAKALVPYFRQILPVLNIFAQRYMSKKMGIDDEKRGVRKVEDLIQELLNALELYGGENAYLNIRYVVPSYTSVLAVL